MNELENRLKEDVKAAMRSGRKDELDVLRMLIAEVKNVAIAKGLERSGVPDDIVLAVLQKAVKTRSESAELYARGGRKDLEQREVQQIEVVRRYLPAELSDAELELVVDTVIVELGAREKADMGRVMKAVLARLAGRADGKRVSGVVAARLG